MIEYKFVKIKEDIIDAVLKSTLKSKAIIVFPNHKSKNFALSKLFDSWHFEEVNIVTIDEFKNQMTLSEKPILQDAKRYILFFKSLNQDIKDKYHLHDYFSAIGFINNFFELFTELQDECVDILTIEEKLISQGFLAQWQQDTWSDLFFIYQEYRAFLDNTAFTDRVFIGFHENNIVLNSFLDKYEKFVFVNQYYFSKTEKEIIKKISNKRKIEIFYQIPEKLVDKKMLSISSFTLQDLISDENPCIFLYSNLNDFTQLNQTIGIIDKNNINTIVDYDCYSSSWFYFLSREKFALPSSVPFQTTEIYNFFKALLNIINSMLFLEKEKKYLIPVHEVFSAFNNHFFRDYFTLPDTFNIEEKKEKNINEVTSENFDILYVFTKFYQSVTLKNILYFDPFNIDPFLSITDDLLIKSTFKKFADLLCRMMNVNQMNQLIDLFDEEDGIYIEDICLKYSKEHTDLLDKFYEGVSNIYSIEELNIITNWYEIFPHNKHKPFVYNLLSFFLEYLKPITIMNQPEKHGQINIVTLVDTRNMIYPKVVFMNVIEGILPKAKAIDFLFNDKQRKLIGLKTYEDIRQREKYYFYRAILSSEESYILYLENEDQNVEKSSFIEELEIYLGSNIKKYICDDIGYIDYYSNNNLVIPHNVDKKTSQRKSIISLPADFSNDFKEPFIISMSVTGLLQFLKNPLLWYLNTYLNFSKNNLIENDSMNPKILGVFTHSFVENLYRMVSSKKSVSLEMFKRSITDENMDKVFSLMTKNSNLYNFPHDFSGKYFEHVLFQRIKEKLKSFFYSDRIAEISGQSNIVLEFNVPKKLFLENEKYKIYLSGKPDMMISDVSTKTKYIIDIKTGKKDDDQLYLYEWLLKNDNEWFYKLFFLELLNDTKNSITPSIKGVMEIQKRLVEVLDKCIKIGYHSKKNEL